MVRHDHNGVTSIIRWLGLAPESYTSLLHFFRADSWALLEIQKCWLHSILANCQLVTIDTRPVAVVDGSKVSKEAEKMPGVERLHQESENSAKPEYIFGQDFGAIGLLIGDIKKFCVPVMVWLQQGRGIEQLTPSIEKLNIISLTAVKVAQLSYWCNKTHDRDLNAAINIHRVGLELLVQKTG